MGDALRRIVHKLGTTGLWSLYSLKGWKGKLPFNILTLLNVIIGKSYALPIVL